MTIFSAYTRAVIAVHNLKSIGTQSIDRLQNVRHMLSSKMDRNFSPLESDYSDTLRKKTRLELVRLSGAVCGIEFCYAAETAFVSPTLLALGLKNSFMTLMWCFSPLIGMILSPILGSLSDNCHSSLGRRRPFIILLSFFIICGLVLTPNGKDIGYLLGDTGDTSDTDDTGNFVQSFNSTQNNHTVNDTSFATKLSEADHIGNHRWGIVFTVLGTILLDFGSDACQSPARTYLLDVTSVEDHALGLSMFSVMAGLGGSMGYAIGGINWEKTSLGEHLGGHIRAVFTFDAILFLILVALTITSFKEIPLKRLKEMNLAENPVAIITTESESTVINSPPSHDYGVFENNDLDSSTKDKDEKSLRKQASINSRSGSMISLNIEENVKVISWKQYLKSIMNMPKSVRWLCLTNLFCWMSLVCYSLYFTDFVGESVFEGDPDSKDEYKRQLFDDGVRFGCWGMCIYSLSCAAYAFVIERLINRIGAKPVYIVGQLVYSIGMIAMALSRSKVAVILLSSTAGVMYATLFTMPYIIVAQYHTAKDFGYGYDSSSINNQIRGIGTDVAVIGAMAFVAQMILSACMGAIIDIVSSPTATVYMAAILAACGSVCATKPAYLKL